MSLDWKPRLYLGILLAIVRRGRDSNISHFILNL